MFTWVEINQKAIEHNLCQFKKLIGSKRLLMPVIKANAYGHGFLDIAKICAKSPVVDRICVVNDDEALLLLQHHKNKPIMILSFYELEIKKALILAKNNVIFPLYSLEQAKFLNKVGELAKKRIKTHLKIDTGASRVGILLSETKKFIKKVANLKHLQIEGVWSHFASSETDLSYTKKQYHEFNQVNKILQKEGINPPLKHMSCSAAASVFTLKGFNAIRLGIGLYGLYPCKKSEEKINLKPALSWNTKIIQLKNVPAQTKIGYGGTYTTKHPTRLAILPIGYWDGMDRRMSNNGTVIIKGEKCPIIGRICMNLTMVDVSETKNVKIGDKAIVIGKSGKIKITADDIAKNIGTINYEVVDRINPLITRVII